MTCWILRAIFLRTNARSWAHFRDLHAVCDLLYNLAQLAADLMFVMRDHAPWTMHPGQAQLEGWLALVANETAAAAAGRARQVSLEVQRLEDVTLANAGALIKREQLAVTDEPIGLFLSLQALVMILLWSRALFFFRGFISFGSLMHTVGEVGKKMIPFVLLLVIVSCGFIFALALLQQHVQSDEQWHHIHHAFFVMTNAGFRFVPPDIPDAFLSRWQVLACYEGFMWCVQLALMNLLIAIMSSELGQLRGQARLMAMYERAKLVLEFEDLLVHKSEGRATTDEFVNSMSSPSLRGAIRWVLALVRSKMPEQEARRRRHRSNLRRCSRTPQPNAIHRFSPRSTAHLVFELLPCTGRGSVVAPRASPQRQRGRRPANGIVRTAPSGGTSPPCNRPNGAHICGRIGQTTPTEKDASGGRGRRALIGACRAAGRGGVTAQSDVANG